MNSHKKAEMLLVLPGTSLVCFSLWGEMMLVHMLGGSNAVLFSAWRKSCHRVLQQMGFPISYVLPAYTSANFSSSFSV